jgi:MFS family permease
LRPREQTTPKPSAGGLNRTPFAALRERDYRVFWTGAAISAIGAQFTTVAMAWQIYELTDSAFQVGLLGLARGIPQVFLLLIGGLLADALDRRRLLMITQLGQLAVAAALAVFTIAGAVTPLILYAGTALLAIFMSVDNPTRQALVPNLVPRQLLTNALALNSTQRQFGQIAGPSLAGLVLAGFGPGPCYAMEAGSRVAMVISLFSITWRSQATPGRSGVTVGAVREGLGFVWTHPVILSMMILDFGVNLFGAPRALFPVFARDVLHVGPQGLGLLYASTAVGALSSAVLMSFFGQVRRAGLWVLVAVAAFSIFTILFGLSHLFWFSLLMLAAEGAGNTAGAVLRQTVNQLNTPDELRGRVTSVNNVFSNGGPQFGQFRSGVVAEFTSPEVSAAAGGLAALAIVVAVAAAVPAVRRYEIPSSLHEERGVAASSRV